MKDCKEANRYFKSGISNTFCSDCFCENLFYINDSKTVECLAPREKICKKNKW